MKELKNKWRSTLTILVFLFCASSSLFSQTKTVAGVVKDENGEAIIGVSISAKGTTTGTISNSDGMFSISVPEAEKTLVFSYIGMKKQEVQISGKQMVVTMESDSKVLDEVVAIGYGTVRKKDLTGSVASISGKTLSSAPVSNVAQALQGKMAGVNIVSQDGRPDAAISIRVRGGGSVSQSNEPLILVDGIAVSSLRDIPGAQIESVNVLKDASSTAIYGARGANGVILVTTKSAKEGSVTVNYDTYLKFNTPTGYLESLSPYEYLKYSWANAAANTVTGTAGYLTPFEKLFGIGSNLGTNAGGIESYKNLPSDDQQKLVYNSSTSVNHDISISGGTDKTRILFAANYLNDQGMKVNSYSKRTNVTLKVNQKLSKNIDFNLDTRYTDGQAMGNESTSSGSGSILSSSYRFRPISTEHILGNLAALKEGNVEQYGKSLLWDLYSPYSRIVDYEPLTIRQQLLSTAALNWKIVKGLTYHTELTLNRSWNQNKTWSGAVYNSYIDESTGDKLWAGSVAYQKSDSWGMRFSNTLNYDFKLSDIHKVNILAGQEVTNSGGTSMQISANHFPANFTKENAFGMINQYDIKNGTSSFNSYINTPNRIVSYFGRGNYSLLDRYLFTFTFRADGSSKFAPTNHWGYFPAGAIAWRVTEEPWMSKLTWMDNLKLRLSYGEVGNDDIPVGAFSQNWTSETDLRYQYTLNHQYQTTYDYANAALSNQKLKWETTITRNVGTDFSIFKGVLSGTVDLYWNTTRDLLLQTGIPGITGFTTTFANVGQTSNKGLELSLTGVIFKNKDWDISATGNINFNKGNVDALSDNVNGLYGTNWSGTGTYPAADYILQVGKPVGLVRGLEYDGFYTPNDFDYANGKYTLKAGVADIGAFIGGLHGIDASERPSGQIAYPGLAKYKDKNADNIINDKDLDIIGNMNPIHTGGFSLNVNYKNFDLGTFFNWSYGNQVYNANKLGSTYGYKEGGVYENKLAFMADAYKMYDIVNGQLVRLRTPEQFNSVNANAAYPIAINENGVTSTFGIEDGSYLRLNTVTLGYSLSKQLMKKIGISSLRIYGSIYNVFTLTKYSGLDPEVSTNDKANNSFYPTPGMDFGAYPRARSFVAGLNISF